MAKIEASIHGGHPGEEKNISIGRPKLSHSDSVIGDNSTRNKISSQLLPHSEELNGYKWTS